MARAGQFGNYYTELANRFFHAVEWQYKKHHDQKGHERECEILSKILDTLISDAVGREIELFRLEAANKEFLQIRDKSFTPKKYTKILESLQIDEKSTEGYAPQLFGIVEYDARASI